MNTIRRHRAALFVAIFVGLITLAPIVLAPQMLGAGYHGVQFLYLDDEDIYRARIHEILDGHGMVGSAYFYEYKNAPVVLVPLGEWLYALPSFVIGLDAAIIVSKFLLPALLFWLVYLLARRLLGDEDDPSTTLTAIVAGLAVTLGIDLVDYHYVFTLFHGSVPRPILWTRLVNPIVGSVAVFGYLVLLWGVFAHPAEGAARKYSLAHIFAGLLLAGMVGYFFSFGISVAILVALAAIVLVQKKYDVLKKFVVLGLVALAASSWFWFNVLSSVGGEEGRALAMRNGMFFTHLPVLNLVLLAATLCVVGSFLYARMRDREYPFTREWVFLVALIAGSWLAFNQQVITGREIWYSHFVQYTVPLSIIAVLVASFHTWRKFMPRLWTLCLCLVGFASLIYGLFTTTQFVPRLNDFARIQEYAAPMAWLREHAPDECVVLVADANQELTRLIPAYTACNVYTTTYTFPDVPKERILHDYLVELRIHDVAPASLHAYLLAHESDVRDNFFTNWKQLYSWGTDPWFLGEVAKIESVYAPFVKADFRQELQTYRIDYIISRGALPARILREISAHVVAASTTPFTIYSL